MNMTLDKWLDAQIQQYNDNPVALLSYLLSSTTALAEQHLDDMRSKAAEAALKGAVKANRALLNKLWEMDNTYAANSEIR